MPGALGSGNMQRCAKLAIAYYDGVSEGACELLELDLLHRAAKIRVSGSIVDANLN